VKSEDAPTSSPASKAARRRGPFLTSPVLTGEGGKEDGTPSTPKKAQLQGRGRLLAAPQT
jgi:hypothetical protein